MCNLVNITFSGARAAIRRGDPLPAPPEAQKAVLLPVPFFHVTGCHSIMIPAMANGSKIVLMYKWNAETALELIERERINGMSGVPSMTWQLLESPDFERRDISSLEGLSYGGAAASPELTRKVAALFPGKFGGTGLWRHRDVLGLDLERCRGLSRTPGFRRARRTGMRLACHR